MDYFSLDVEGSEFPILRSIPWEKIKIKVKTISKICLKETKFRIKHSIETKNCKRLLLHIFQVLSVEVAHSDKSKIQHYMKENGYILAHEIPPPPHTLDHIYVRRDTWNSIS